MITRLYKDLELGVVALEISEPRFSDQQSFVMVIFRSKFSILDASCVWGEDGLQATVLGLERARQVLLKHKGISWMGGPSGESGIPRSVPMFLDPDGIAKVHAVLDEQEAAMERFIKK